MTFESDWGTDKIFVVKGNQHTICEVANLLYEEHIFYLQHT